jgi:polar amino acid transport system substrate-binding protein
MLRNARIAALACVSNFLLGAVLAGSLEDVKAKGELVAGIKTDYPPYGFRDKDGQIVGFEPDLAADLAKRLGVSLKIVPVLSSNRIEFLRERKIDLIIATLSITAERRKLAGIIDPPYYASGVGLLVRHGVRIQETSELEGRTLCTIGGNVFLADLQLHAPAAKTIIFSDVPSAEQALFEGQCEALFFNDNLLAYKKQTEPDRFKDYDAVPLTDIDPLLWGIAITRGEEQSALGTFVSQVIVDWHRSGFLLAVEKRWLGSNTALLRAMNVKWAPAASGVTAYTQKASFGTPAEARAMLEKVVAGMKANKTATLAQISKGEGGFKDRDLYPYCIGPNGKYVAHPDPSRVGLVYKDVRDKSGKAYGQEVSRLAAEGKIGEVHYVFPRPTDGTLRPKVGLFTKVVGHICVVGYYK